MELPVGLGIEHLAKTAWCSPSWGKVLFPMFTACFDASGKEADHNFIVVAGFIASADTWIEFSKKWKTRLTEDHINVFHAVDFSYSYKEFKSWRHNEPRRRALLRDLVDLIQSHACRQIGCVLERTYQDHLSPENIKRFCVNGYAWAGRTCADEVSAWALSEHIHTPIEFVFEDGDEGKGLLMKRFERDGFLNPSFRCKTDRWKKGILCPEFVPLQACDLWAYEIFKAMQNQSEERWAYQVLSKMMGGIKIYDSADLDDLERTMNTILAIDEWASGLPSRKN